VEVPIEEAWKTLTDVERIAPCLPGAQLQEIEDDVYRGIVKVKVGPILAQFKGQATFLERDDENHRAVLKAEGRDTGGKGNASALITAQLDAVSPASTKVTVTTDLTITGKVAQFGRGALADVSTKLLNQFVDQLHTTVLHPDASEATSADETPAATSAPAATAAAPAATAAAPAATADGPATASRNGDPAVRKIDHPENDPVDLVDVAGGAVLKRLAPLAVIGFLVVLVLLLRRRRGR
jgi:carbon monoxide dehydrogenase subunit G